MPGESFAPVRRELMSETIRRLETRIRRYERRYECTSADKSGAVRRRKRDRCNQPMIDGLPDPPPAPRQVRRWSHDWYSYEGYRTIHDRRQRDLKDAGIILDNRIAFRESVDASGDLVEVRVKGRVHCAEGAIVGVYKGLEVRRDVSKRYEVRGIDYVYHAWLHGSEIAMIRYCAAHGMDDLHVHRFDPATGLDEKRSISFEEPPTLDAILIEAVELAQQTQVLR